MARVLSLILLLFAVAALAGPEETPTAPDPSRLAPDWWTYFEPEQAVSREEQGKRVAETLRGLDALLDSLDPVQREQQLPAVQRVVRLLERFQELRGAQPPAERPAPPAAERYRIDEALERHRALRALKLELSGEAQEADWQQALVVSGRREQSRRRVSYLELDRADPRRLGLGLDLMATRLQLEIRALDLSQRRARLTRLQADAELYQKEIDAIPERLTAQKAEEAGWQEIRTRALGAADRLRSRMDEAPVSAAGGADSPEARVGARLAALEAVILEVEIAIQEVLALRGDLGALLVELLIRPEGDRAGVRAGLDAWDQALAERDRKIPYWQRTLDYARRSLAEALAGLAEGEAAALARRARIAQQSGEQVVQHLGQEQETAAFIADLLQRRLKLAEGLAHHWMQEAGDVLAEGWEASQGLLTASLFEVNETPVTALGLLRVVLILTLAWLLSKGVRKGLQRIAERRSNVNQSSFYALGRVIHYFVLVLGIIIGLSSVGIDFTKFALLASALGIGIGFGMQTLVSNFVAGLIILFEKSLKVGDFVELSSGVTGEVREINMRSTLITTNDNVDILVPNSEFINKEVTNWTLREVHRRVRVPFGVAYGSDKELVRKAGLEAADAVRWTLKGQKRREPQVWLVGFGDSALNFELVVWLTSDAVKRPGSVSAAYLWELETALSNYGIEVPFPQRDLHVRSLFGLKDEAGRELLQERRPAAQ